MSINDEDYENIDEDNEKTSKKKQIQGILFFSVGALFSGWIAFNIFLAYGYEIYGFFGSCIKDLCNFFGVIFKGERYYQVEEAPFSWWVILFGLACYVTFVAGRKAFQGAEKLFSRD